MPAISVIMPVYNGARFLQRAVASVRAQTFPDWELLAVDDGSTDNSAALLEAFAVADSRIHVFRHTANRGLSAARNTALAQARGQLIAYLDCDDEYYPDHLARAYSWPDNSDVLVFRIDQLDELAESQNFGRVIEYDPATRYRFMFTETIAIPLSIVHRRQLFERVGVFDEQLGRYHGQAEDADLWRRFACAGATFIFVPHKSGLYHVRSDSLSRTYPVPPLPASGLLSTVVPIEIRAGSERHTLHVPKYESSVTTEIFEKLEYGGIPLAKLRTPPVILDVGANVGTFAMYAKLAIHRDAVIHCFEPYPPTIELLRRNLASFWDITIHPVGLSHSDMEADLLLNPIGAVANTVRPDLVAQPVGRVQVSLRAAAAVWDELGLTEVDILKVDAEGSEIDILESLGERLARCRIVLAEFHSPADRRRIDALLPHHELFGTSIHSIGLGVVKYIRASLLDG